MFSKLALIVGGIFWFSSAFSATAIMKAPIGLEVKSRATIQEENEAKKKIDAANKAAEAAAKEADRSRKEALEDQAKKAADEAENASKKASEALEADAKKVQEKTISSWDLSLGGAAEHYRHAYVKKASIHGDDRIVVIDEEYKSEPSLWLIGTWSYMGCQRCTWIKPGVFVGVKVLGQDSTALEGVAIGLNFSLLENVEVVDEKKNSVAVKRPAWNLGIGWVNHKTQELARGIIEGQGLPDHFDDIGYRKSADDGWMIMVSKNVAQ